MFFLILEKKVPSKQFMFPQKKPSRFHGQKTRISERPSWIWNDRSNFLNLARAGREGAILGGLKKAPHLLYLGVPGG